MRSVSRGCFLAMLAGAVLYGQDPANVKYDTPRVKVYMATERPHHAGAIHEHKVNRVLVYLDAGTMSFTTPDGKVEKREFKAGQAVWSPASGPHVSENITDNPIRLWEIELKGGPMNPPVQPSKLDPLKVDPKHYSLEFENDQVRVLRVKYPPKEKGVLHEHTMDHIVVYLTDQARGKAGEIRLDGVMTHTEENPLDQPVERLAIDLK